MSRGSQDIPRGCHGTCHPRAAGAPPREPRANTEQVPQSHPGSRSQASQEDFSRHRRGGDPAASAMVRERGLALLRPLTPFLLNRLREDLLLELARLKILQDRMKTSDVVIHPFIPALCQCEREAAWACRSPHMPLQDPLVPPPSLLLLTPPLHPQGHPTLSPSSSSSPFPTLWPAERSLKIKPMTSRSRPPTLHGLRGEGLVSVHGPDRASDLQLPSAAHRLGLPLCPDGRGSLS